MRICVDTSVWVAALRGKPPAIGLHLQNLLDEDAVLLPIPVRLEVLAGAGKADQARLRRDLSALPLLLPGDETWLRMETWCEAALGAGERFGFADLLIAALAVEHDAAVWSLDHAFIPMARCGFIQTHEPGSA